MNESVAQILRSAETSGVILRYVITPDLARYLLTLNTSNRPIQPKRVTSYAQMMSAGMWKCNIGDALVFSDDGRLMNGQHRLLAIIESGVAQVMAVITNVPFEHIANMDSGIIRPVHQMLQIVDQRPNAKREASVIRSLYVACRNLSTADAKLNREQTNAVRSEFSDEYQAIQDAIGPSPKGPYRLVGIAAASIFFLAAYPENSETVCDFCRRLVTGEMLRDGSPILALRNHLTLRFNGGGHSPRLADVMVMTCTHIDHHLRGSSISRAASSLSVFQKAYDRNFARSVKLLASLGVRIK